MLSIDTQATQLLEESVKPWCQGLFHETVEVHNSKGEPVKGVPVTVAKSEGGCECQLERTLVFRLSA